MRLVFMGAVVMGWLISACGGKAVIDAPLGQGGSGASDGGGGAGPGAGGAGGTGGARCVSGAPGLIEVFGDGDQVFNAAGPGQETTVPFGQVFYSPQNIVLNVRGCASNMSTNNCVAFGAPKLDQPGQTGEGSIAYTSGQGIVFVGDFAYVEVYNIDAVGGRIVGYFEADTYASGGADYRYVYGQFDVCRQPDIIAD
jgi:hypothetical protein